MTSVWPWPLILISKLCFSFILARSSLLFDIGIPNLARWCLAMRQHVCIFMTDVWPWPLTNIHGWWGNFNEFYSQFLSRFFFKKKFSSPKNLASIWRKQLWWVRKALYMAPKYFEEIVKMHYFAPLWKKGHIVLHLSVCLWIKWCPLISFDPVLECSLTWYSGSL